MSVRLTVLGVLIATGASAIAQTSPAGKSPPATPATPPAASGKLDEYLRRWEREMHKVQTLNAVIGRVNKDKVFGLTRKYTGFAQYMKSGSGPTAMNLAVLELKEEGKADFAEKFVCTGTYIYQFLPAQKEIRAYELPKPKPGQVGDESFLGFLFGMKAEEAKRRYELTLAKEDTWYVYVDIKPRFANDKHDFARARLVLNKDSFLPRQLWFEQNNGSEITWDIPRLQSGAAINRRIFDAPQPPSGWKLVPVNRDAPTAPPRVIRGSK
jgi:TIGR03009 family protein